MENKRSEVCELLLKDPEAVYPSVCHKSTILEERQSEELNEMRKEIRSLCEEGKDGEAERVAETAKRIVFEGPPAR